jgi:hypothetical protein
MPFSLYKKTFKPLNRENNMTKKQSFLQKRSVAATIGILALLGGFYFLNTGFLNPVTGNVVRSNYLSVNFVSAIGMLLILCSAVLIVYAIVKRE